MVARYEEPAALRSPRRARIIPLPEVDFLRRAIKLPGFAILGSVSVIDSERRRASWTVPGDDFHWKISIPSVLSISVADPMKAALGNSR